MRLFASKKSSRPRTATFGGGPVGTEAVASQSLDWNAKTFRYPENGFFNRIEHTSLYSMVRSEDIFPPSVVKEAIESEDFSVYLHARPSRGSSAEAPVSYAQLTATMALAGDVWKPDTEVPQSMCKAALKTVIQYAEEHGLDRKTETDELLKPILDHAKDKESEEALTVLAPFYVGWAASMITGNPLPMLAMYTVANVASIKSANEEFDSRSNVHDMVKATERASDIEHASLLDECEYSSRNYDDE